MHRKRVSFKTIATHLKRKILKTMATKIKMVSVMDPKKKKVQTKRRITSLRQNTTKWLETFLHLTISDKDN